MHSAPPIEVDLAAGRDERIVIMLLYAACAAVLACWLAAQLNLPVWPPLLLATPLAAMLGWWVACGLLPRQPRRLGWSGQCWQLRTGLAAGGVASSAQASPVPLRQLDLQLDAGGWLLLRWQQADGRHAGWGIARAAAAGSGWHGLRIALQAHAGAPQPLRDAMA